MLLTGHLASKRSVGSRMSCLAPDPHAYPPALSQNPYCPRTRHAYMPAHLPRAQSLRENNKPYADHGVEVLYRFANFDPFQRAKYFG